MTAIAHKLSSSPAIDIEALQLLAMLCGSGLLLSLLELIRGFDLGATAF
jgi:hypothetical protein